MPNYIVLRLIPAVPVAPDVFTSYLNGLTVKVFDISYAHPRAGNPGDPTAPIGSAKYQTPTVLVPPKKLAPPFIKYPANTTIAQHYALEHLGFDVSAIDFQSVATAVIPYPGGGPEYVRPDLRIEFDRTGAAALLDANVYYDVPLYSAGGPPDPADYQDIDASAVSAYVTLKAPINPALAQLNVPTDGTPPNYDALMAAVTTVLTSDPGGAPTQAEIAALSIEQCRNIAYEIVYGPQQSLPPLPEPLEKMYTNPPNDGSNTNSDEQSRQDFQGKLNSYYSVNNATSEHLTRFVFSLACAVWCELQTASATRAMVTFPVNPGAISPGLTTVAQADVIFTGALGADVPSEYFYALTAQMPVQVTAVQRFQMATTGDQQQNLTRLTDALDAGIIVMPPTAPQPAVNPAQAVRLLTALAVPANSPAVQCPVVNIQPMWTDWLAFPKTAPPPDNWRTFTPGDDLTQFWPAEATAQPGQFLDLVLFVLTQGYVDPGTAVLLATEIKANLLVTPPAGPPPPPAHIANVGDLTKALPTDWQNFFAPGGVVNANLLPPFTLPGTPEDRVRAFIRYVQKFFNMPAPVPVIGAPGAEVPPALQLPTFDLIQACLAAYGGLVFGSAPLTAANLANLAAAAAATVPGDKDTQDWLVETIEVLNDLAILGNIPGKSQAFLFSVAEALYARGFTSTDSVLELAPDDFQQALTGTVAYDVAATIYANAGVAGGVTSTGTGTFGPINPGSLTNCVPPFYLSPLGPIEYLHEMLKVSEASTCGSPFAPPEAGHTTLEKAIENRRGSIGSLAVSKANLETPLPCIDLVNECLEFMASTTPPTPYGVVYDTSEDALAGHKLCSEECGCERGCNEHTRNGTERLETGDRVETIERPDKPGICHKPAPLFASMPEYSTPATPVTANAAVAPAVYDKLKMDFSVCCQPYSQALDESRTYLRHLRTCRFETMRTFRRCITEFVLDPVNEPAGFQSHLWRYPVRIDTAIEYLGISPEVYTFLFEGPAAKVCVPVESTVSDSQDAQLQPWMLYGFSADTQDNLPWTSVAVRLPEFLRRTCLTYCEFLELWKTGIVSFSDGAGRENGMFPECEPCCMEDHWLQFPEEEREAITGLYKLAIFVRLHCILREDCGPKYSYAQLQDICQVLQLFIGNNVNGEFIRQLTAFQMLRDRFRMPLTDRNAVVPPNATGAARTQLLALWVPGSDHWEWAVKELIGRICSYATCQYRRERRPREYEKLLEANLDPLSQLAGFDPGTPANTWHTLPTHTLRFAEVLAKIYASNFTIGEILYLFTTADHLDGDDPFPLQEQNEALDAPLGLPDDDHRHSLGQLRRKLLDVHIREDELREWHWHQVSNSLQHDFGFDPAEIKTFGEHFFPRLLGKAGSLVDMAHRQFVSPLAPVDTAPLMWNAPPRGPFEYNAGTGQLWTQLPITDEDVIEQLTRIRALQPKERAAVQDLYFQPRAMLARFAFVFSDYAQSELEMIQKKDESYRWQLFRDRFVRCRARCHVIAEHLAQHVAAATGQEHPEGAEAAHLVLRSLFADENKAVAGGNWEDDSGHAPAVTWAPQPNGGAFAALLGLTGTGMIGEITPQGGALAWRAPSGALAAFGFGRDFRNCPVPTVVPGLDFALQPEQMRFVSVHNGLARQDSTGAWLGGAEGFAVTWTGGILIERDGTYDITAHALARGDEHGDEHEEGRRRWRITVRRGQKTWIAVSHHWHGEHNRAASSLPLRQGAYELTVDFVQPTPTFFDEDDLFPLHTGLEVKYSGPDTEGKLIAIPHDRTLVIKKEGPLGTGIAGLSPGASSYLNQLYVSSLRDIRRTYQRAFKAFLFVHRMALSAHRLAAGQSELGYMLAHKEQFAGASYFAAGGPFQKHNADLDFNLLPLQDNYYTPAGDARSAPAVKRVQALFDWWERLFDYDFVRREVRRHAERHLWLLFEEASDKKPVHPAYLLRHMGADTRHWESDVRYFQGQAVPIYSLTSDDLEDDRWGIRAWHSDVWIRELVRSFAAGDITQARPDLWASDNPGATLPGEAMTGNANLSRFLSDGCLENATPLRYEDLKRLNDGLRVRGRRALLAYLCGPAGIAKSPKEISENLLLDVETGLHEYASRIDDAITAVQTFIQRSRLNLETGWKVSKSFALLWDRRFMTYHAWEACRRRELYKENYIEWSEIEKAERIEAFRFLDEELRRATLTIARPGGVDYWPDERPPGHAGVMPLQERQRSEMQLLPVPREGLDLFAAEERAGRPTWLTNVPEAQQNTGGIQSAPGITGLPAVASSAVSAGGTATAPKLPFWMESAVAMGTRFLRIAASGYPPAATEFEPRPEHKKKDGADGCCVSCCVHCGRVHPLRMDEYYFWLVDGRFYKEVEQDEHYDQNLQVATPWHDKTQLKSLLDWTPESAVRLAWCRVHNGEFDQPRRSEFGVAVPDSGTLPDLTFAGRVADSLYFDVSNAVSATAGFRYDLAPDSAIAESNLTVPPAPPVPYPGGLFAYPYFAYLVPGARLFPWSLYTPAVAVAHALRSHCRFEAALKWYALPYDPLHSDNTWMRCEKDTPPPPSPAGTPAGIPSTTTAGPDESAGSMCCDSTAVSCAVARNRSVVLYYLDTLLQWSQVMMRRNSPEAFQQARLILDTAARILGPTPKSVTNTPPAGTQTVSTFTALFPPLNPRLMMLYEHVHDQLALIHAWMNLRRHRNGILAIDMPYFGNDPIREGWRSNCQVCPDEADWCLPHSPYRFSFLLGKARELAARVRELGSVLMMTFEKGDAEFIAALRARQERELATLGLQARQNQYRDSDWQVQALQKTKENRQNDRRYYAQLIQNGLSNSEQQYVAQVGIGQDDRNSSMEAEGTAEVLSTVVDLFVGFPCEETWLPLGTKLSGLFQGLARISNTLAEMASTEGSLDLTQAGWDRRTQDWVHRVELLDIEIEQIELQILAAERRRAQALREVNIQQRQIENAGELQDFLRDKFSSHAVYLYLQKEVSELFYKTYDVARYTVRQTERAFNFERGHTTRRFLPEETWDNLHEGLLAGERLQLALDYMEKEYEDRNVREEELTKHISLRLHFPMEFLRLKVTGRCEFEIPEWLFDLDYPGHYMRRIKSVALTIPCVTGPYTGVHCRLTLLSSATRIDPLLPPPARRCCNECAIENPYVACAHDPRVVRQYAARDAIATSAGRNDTGLFELNFHDDRYLPFEYQGAVSRWRIELPRCNNFWDMDSLTDVVMQLNYTAREGGELLRHAANEVAQQYLPGSCWTFFDIRHDFPDSWQIFRAASDHNGRPRELTLRLNRNMFPFLPGRDEIFINRMALLFETPERTTEACPIAECPCPEERKPDSHVLDLTTCRVERHGRREEREADMHCLASREWPELYHGMLETHLGPIARHEGEHEAKFQFHHDVGRVSRAYLFCQYSARRCDQY